MIRRSAHCRTLLALALIAGWIGAPRVQAAKPPQRGLTAARLTEVDDDYAFQGEFLGRLDAVDQEGTPVGLQVAALGQGKFQAFSYRGGLPGGGAVMSTQKTWKGDRQADRLLLHHDDQTVQLSHAVATWYDSAGKPRGNLGRVIRQSRTLGATPPPGATVLLRGGKAANLKQVRLTPEGWMLGGALTEQPVHDFHLHVEFRTPYKPAARDQARGNSGIYIQRRYEIQVLDSFGFPTVFNGGGALYRQQPPLLNMCLPPLVWQTYDIYFRAARWNACGEKAANARVTVLHNGVQIHRDREVTAKTGAGQVEAPADLPILFQDHGNPVQYRNLWLVALEPQGPDSRSTTRVTIRRRRR